MAISKERFLKSIMHEQYRYVNKKELKEYLDEINKRFAFNYDFSDYVFVRSSDKIWICSPDVLNHDYSRMSIEGIGMVFARIIKKEGVKLTSNAVQMFGKFATKNVFELSEEEVEAYIRGMNLTKHLETDEGYVILRHGNDYIGLGKYIPYNKMIKNLIPKARRIKRF